MSRQVTQQCKNSHCRKEFKARLADVRRGWGLFCSKSCKAKEQEARTGQYAALNQRSERNDIHPFEEDAFNP